MGSTSNHLILQVLLYYINLEIEPVSPSHHHSLINDHSNQIIRALAHEFYVNARAVPKNHLVTINIELAITASVYYRQTKYCVKLPATVNFCT